jgi:hypothetical protein
MSVIAVTEYGTILRKKRVRGVIKNRPGLLLFLLQFSAAPVQQVAVEMDLFLLLGLDVDSANTTTTEELTERKKILGINATFGSQQVPYLYCISIEDLFNCLIRNSDPNTHSTQQKASIETASAFRESGEKIRLRY